MTMITVQKKFDKIGPVIAGVLMITVLFIASFFLTGWGSYLLLFFLIGLTEFLSRTFFKSGILAMIFPFAAFSNMMQSKDASSSHQDTE
ncbi:MAG: hypothetical protein WCI23_12340 [Chlorobiaceae bacterium]